MRTSMFVNKQCVMEEDCTQDMIGCHNTETDGIKVCVQEYTCTVFPNIHINEYAMKVLK